jgi:predicted enzyme related to lactoylglutathione lyase
LYVSLTFAGEAVALLYELQDWQRSAGAGPNWATFVSVEDVDLTAGRAVSLGGSVAILPYEVAGAGRIAVITDPSGARLSLWQPQGKSGAARVGALGSLAASELVTPDLAVAERFYAQLFGWGIGGDGDGGAVIDTGGRVPARFTASAAPHSAGARWLPYFRVARMNTSVRAAITSAGRLVAGPRDLASGRSALLRDPQGAVFGVMQLDAATELRHAVRLRADAAESES